MANKERYSAKTIIAALKETKGMVYLAANRLGCHADTVKNYAKRYPTVASEIANQDGMVNDVSELKLIQAINNGEGWAIKYRLSTKAKDRGYGDNIEIKHSGYIGATADERARAQQELDEWNQKADAT